MVVDGSYAAEDSLVFVVDGSYAAEDSLVLLVDGSYAAKDSLGSTGSNAASTAFTKMSTKDIFLASSYRLYLIGCRDVTVYAMAVS